ncbi:MAG: tetratricopeptide repeat protein [Fibrobacteres bacterium]|nr:tetratricopeptide repeat protein [Fibrobacterota bacterium]
MPSGSPERHRPMLSIARGFLITACLATALAAASRPVAATRAGADTVPPKSAGIDLRLEVAKQWETKGEYDKAVQELRLYLSEHPENPGPIYARVGGLRLKQGNYKLAGENFKIALAKDPSLADARAGLALAYEKQGEKAKAEEERKKLAAMSGAKPTAMPQAAPAPATVAAKPAAASDELPPPPRESGSAVPIAGGDEAFSPALDSGSSKGGEGIYADKDFLAALEAYKAGKLDAMAAPLRRCLSRHPGHPGAFYLGGVMRFDKGDYAKALFNFKRALAYPDRGFNAHYYMGRIYQKQERFPQATAEFRDYLKTTRSAPGRKQAEAFMAQMGEGTAAATPGASATPGNPAPSGAPAPAGAPASPGQKPPAAAKAPAAAQLKETTAKDAAHESGAPEEAANPAGKDGKPAVSAKPTAPAQPAAKTPPQPVPPSEAKALVLGRDGSFLFLIPDPESASGKKMHEAHLLAKNDKFEKAIAALKEVMLGYGGSDNAQAAGLDMASVYLQLGLWDQAAERAADQTGSAPQDSAKFHDAAQYLSALAALGMKDGEKAEKALLKIKPGAPDGPAQVEVEYRLAQAGALQNDAKKSAGYLEKGYANAKDPARKAGYARDLGGLHAKYGALDKALAWYGKATAECQDPKDSLLADLCAEVKLRMADLAFRKKDWKGAMAQYRQFAAKWPGHKEAAWVHYQMANIYKTTGNLESALNEYKRVIDNYPDSYWASQAKWKREDAIWRKEYEEVLD